MTCCGPGALLPQFAFATGGARHTVYRDARGQYYLDRRRGRFRAVGERLVSGGCELRVSREAL